MDNIGSSKFYTLFSSLNTKEKKHFLLYLENKAFNPSNKILLLVQTVHDTQWVVRKSNLFETIFPKTYYDDRKLRNLLSRAYTLLVNFLTINHLLEDPLHLSNLNSKVLEERVGGALLENKFLKWDEALQKNKESNSTLLQETLNYEEARFHYSVSTSTSAKRLIDLNASSYNNSIDHYFIYQKLQLFIGALNFQTVAKSKEEFPFFKVVTHYFSKDENDIPISLWVYYRILMCYYQPEDETNFEMLLSSLQEVSSQFEHEELRQCYLHAQNYCIRKVNNGNGSYLEQLFEIYKTMIANGTIFINGTLSQFSYKNIVSAGLRLKEYTWTLEFIKAYITYLPTKQQESALAFNMANYYFYTKDYQKAIPLLHEVDYTDVFYILGSKVMLLKIYYDLDEYNSLISLTESFNKLLSRKKLLTERHQISHKNFLKLLKQIIQIRKEDTPVLINKIKSTSPLTDKNWLLEKVNELK